MDVHVLRVIKLFGLTVPPMGVVAVCYVGMGEHVFGLCYVVGRRIRPRVKRLFRAAYLSGMSLTAIGLLTALMTTCGGTASVCPPVRLGERNCLISASVGALWTVVTMCVERCANPLLDLKQPTGVMARTSRASALIVLWFCMAYKQTAAVLILSLLTTRRALAPFPWVDRQVGRLLKLVTSVHMSRVISHQCDDAAVPKYAVAALVAMVPL